MQFLDPDRTHDILFAQKIKGSILALLKTAIGDRGLFDDPFPIAFIDRITPGGLTPWADNWSGLMFEFLKKLSQTHILDDGYLNGSAYGFEPPYQADLPAQIDLSTYKTNTITVRVPAGTKNGVLTWIERNHDAISAPYCANFANPIATTTRRSRVFNNPGPTPKTFTLSTKNWLHNSVCFAGIELQGLTDNQAEFLLYDQMQSFLDYLWGELNIPECRVLKGMTVKLRTVFLVDQRQWAWNAASSTWTSATNFLTFENPIFDTVPDSYFYASLQKEDEYLGSPRTPIFSNGSLQLELAYNYDFFANWEKISGRVAMPGFSRDPGLQLSPEWSCPVPYNPTFVDFQITAFNVPVYFSSVPGSNEIAPYPPFSLSQKADAAIPNNLVTSSEGAFRFFPYFDFNEDGEIAANIQFYGYPINQPEYSVGVGINPGLSIQENMVEGINLSIHPDFIGITFFCGDPNLFKNSTSVIFWHDIARKSVALLEEDSNGYIQIGRSLEDLTTKLTIKIDATYQDYLLQEPTFSAPLVNSSAQSIFADSTTWGLEGIEYIELPYDPIEIEAVSTVTLSKIFA